MIKLNNVTKMYGKNVGINDVSFTINEGEVVGLLGKNGAGKTTAMNVITGYLAPTDGEIEIDGSNAMTNPIKVRKSIGYMPEKPPIYMEMTVDEYLSFCAELNGIKKEQIKKHIDDICKLVRIEEVRKRLCKNLSKGYKQRVGLAQALVGNPKILILDEPTAGLDPKQIIEIRKLIKALGKKHTLILSSHILNEISQICDRVIIIDKGNVLADDTISNLSLGNKGTMMVDVTIDNKKADANPLEIIKAIKGVKSVTKQDIKNTYRIVCNKGYDCRSAVSNALCNADMPVIMMNTVKKGLEEIFIQLTDRKDNDESNI